MFRSNCLLCINVLYCLQARKSRPSSLLRIKEKAAVKIMAIVIGLFLVTYSFSLRCSFIYILNDDEKPCDGQEYKIPLLVLNSVVNPFAYVVFKRDINMEMTRYICCVVCKKRNRTEPIDENNSFILRSWNAKHVNPKIQNLDKRLLDCLQLCSTS